MLMPRYQVLNMLQYRVLRSLLVRAGVGGAGGGAGSIPGVHLFEAPGRLPRRQDAGAGGSSSSVVGSRSVLRVL